MLISLLARTLALPWIISLIVIVRWFHCMASDPRIEVVDYKNSLRILPPQPTANREATGHQPEYCSRPLDRVWRIAQGSGTITFVR